uniref:Uncharacterized protein n=4 Tax=Oryza TaxID=4527 RepID=A0A0D3FAR2_9ORYZ
MAASGKSLMLPIELAAVGWHCWLVAAGGLVPVLALSETCRVMQERKGGKKLESPERLANKDGNGSLTYEAVAVTCTEMERKRNVQSSVSISPIGPIQSGINTFH